MHFYFFGSNNYNRQQKDAQRLLILVYLFINISNASTFINVISSISTIIRPLTIQWTERSKLTDLPQCKRYSRNLFNDSLYDKNWYNWNRHKDSRYNRNRYKGRRHNWNHRKESRFNMKKIRYNMNWHMQDRHNMNRYNKHKSIFSNDLSVRLYIYFIVYSIIYSLYILLFNYHSMSYYMGILLGQYSLIKYLSIQLNNAVSEFFS